MTIVRRTTQNETIFSKVELSEVGIKVTKIKIKKLNANYFKVNNVVINVLIMRKNVCRIPVAVDIIYSKYRQVRNHFLN